MSKQVIFKAGPTNYLNQPMFFGDSVSTARYDQQTYPFFEKLIEKQLSFFWRPEEVDVSADRRDWQGLSKAEKHIFISNLQYQTLLDSIQGRSPNIAFLPITSVPEVETWIETWSFSETIHSRSYTHIMRNILTGEEMDEVFNGITTIPEIIARAERFGRAYEELIECNNALLQSKVDVPNRAELEREQKRKFLRALVTVNGLEALAFYVSFACSWAFAERSIMEGNAKIIRLIAR
ncbi:ribonucleotide-diphosphate reductase beta subunit [Vibrio phage BONAISHI]|nr:ribonucleotide-diphosphate reductase beta subunit [Vibrio phage BONAISHI]